MKFVPYDKLSKKKKREADRARRGSWGALSPVTRRAPDPKAYRREKLRLDEETEFFSLTAAAVTKQSPLNGTAFCAIMQ